MNAVESAKLRREVIEDLHQTNFALESLTELLSVAGDNINITPQKLYFLLNIIVKKQTELVDQLDPLS